MNPQQKKIVLFGAPLLLLVAALMGYIVVNGGVQTEVTPNPAEQTIQLQQADTKPKEKYTFYTPEVMSQAAKGRRVLFFFAAWCPTCKAADTEFMANVAQIPEDVTVIKVNYNDSQTDEQEKELAKKYDITYQHTFVQIDAEGKEITKWNGGDINELLTNIK